MTRALHLDVRCFPRSDDAFAAEVDGLLGELPDSRSLRRLVDGLELELHRARTAAVVRVQDHLASIGGDTVVYVFRDGSLIPGPRDDQRGR